MIGKHLGGEYKHMDKLSDGGMVSVSWYQYEFKIHVAYNEGKCHATILAVLHGSAKAGQLPNNAL